MKTTPSSLINKPESSINQRNALKSVVHPSTSFLSNEATLEITSGRIPDLSLICSQLFDINRSREGQANALEMIPALKSLNALTAVEFNQLLNHPKSSHVLIQNTWMKAILICWEPGKFSSIHGHPKGGCVFKVLNGQLEEKRYRPDGSDQQLGKSIFQSGAMAYIDDDMAYHAVGNPFNKPAISLHVYTYGPK